MTRCVFWAYVFLLPFFSSPYLYGAFRSWSINYSLFPLLALFFMWGLGFLRKAKFGAPPEELRAATSLFAKIQFYSLFVTVVASLVLELSGFQTRDVYRGPAWNTIKEVLRALLSFVAFYIVVTQVRSVDDVRRFMRLMHVSLMVLVVYGYLQLSAVIWPSSPVHELLATVTPVLDQGWPGKAPSPNLYLDWYKRINLLTPEASTAAQVLEVFFLPLLLASRLAGVSVWRRRIGAISVEMALIIAVLPLLLATLSSVGFLCLLALLAACLLSTAHNWKRFAVLAGSVGVAFTGAILLISSYGLLDLVWFMATKVGDSSNGSTNSRYALLQSSFDLFLHHPWGVGTNNNNVLMAQHLPEWSARNPEIALAVANENLPTLNLWTEILSSAGLIGFVMTLVFFSRLWRLNRNRDGSPDSAFKHHAFVLFMIAFILHGFSTAATTFFWMWSICGFYAVLGSVVGNPRQPAQALGRVRSALKEKAVDG